MCSTEKNQKAIKMKMDKSKNHKKKQRDSKEVSAPAAAFATMCVFLLSGPSLWWKLAR